VKEEGIGDKHSRLWKYRFHGMGYNNRVVFYMYVHMKHIQIHRLPHITVKLMNFLNR